MINKHNFEKLSKKNQIKKILFLLDNCLLNIKLGEKTKLPSQIQNLFDYMQIYGNLNSYLSLLKVYLDKIQNGSSLNYQNLLDFLLKLRYEIFLKIDSKNYESDFINYTRYGSSEGKISEASGKDLIVLLDNIRSPFNAGSIIRSAEAFGFKSVFFYGITTNIPFEKIYRTSMNAEKLIEVCLFKEEEKIFEFIEKNGYEIAILEKNNNSKKIWDFCDKKKLIIVCGNEEFGVSEVFLRKADYIIEIPQYGIKNSINVASAFSIAASWLAYKAQDTKVKK